MDGLTAEPTGPQGALDSRIYQWQNTGARVTIDISEAINGGSAMLTIRDARGSVMYQADIGADSDSTTVAPVSSGAA